MHFFFLVYTWNLFVNNLSSQCIIKTTLLLFSFRILCFFSYLHKKLNVISLFCHGATQTFWTCTKFITTYQLPSCYTWTHTKQITIQVESMLPLGPSSPTVLTDQRLRRAIMETQHTQPDPGKGPKDHLFFADLVQAHILKWVHTSHFFFHHDINPSFSSRNISVGPILRSTHISMSWTAPLEHTATPPIKLLLNFCALHQPIVGHILILTLSLGTPLSRAIPAIAP